MSVANAVLIVAGMVAFDVAGLRWLRVSQREHYLPGAASRFAVRWWSLTENVVVATAAVLALAGFVLTPFAVLPVAVACVIAPYGLSIRGRTSPLAWTKRLKRLAATTGAIHLLVVGAAIAASDTVAVVVSAVMAAASPLVVDCAARVMVPLEARLSIPWVAKAQQRLDSVKPTVVAITGSYGKTTAKGYTAHLIAGTASVVATPASFNNKAGLSRAINEHLTPGTNVFIAEMGTYGRGEIAELCSWIHPAVAVITAIGPVHLERMKSESNIVKAKSEILEGARVAVISVDHPLLRALSELHAAAGQRVIRCATSLDGDVLIDGDKLVLAGEIVCEIPVDHRTVNLACAVGVARELGVPVEAIAARIATLPTPPHRLVAVHNDQGVIVLDDTYNANPAGGQRALDRLSSLAAEGHRRIVVTPGMVELGSQQRAANEAFGRAASEVATDMVVVGRTNRAALVAGAGLASKDASATVHLVDTLAHAVGWVRQYGSDGDVVLYENDLPDHYA